jgi:hypothetical protein
MFESSRLRNDVRSDFGDTDINMRNTEAAFRWIIQILQNNNIPFQITGGFAARLYGANRELHDIDIDIPEEDFPKIVPLVEEYIIRGPLRYTSDKWDLQLMTLLFEGQEIDLGGAFEGKMFDKDANDWVDITCNFATAKLMDVYGLKVPVVNKEELIAYKRIVARDTDLTDVSQMTAAQ